MDAASRDGAVCPGPHVVLVNDIGIYSRLAQQVLRRFAPEFADAEFRFGGSGEEAVELRFADRPPSVMMINGVMPGMWGTEAIRRIRQREAATGLPRVPIVFDSADLGMIEEALRDGADAALWLPLEPRWLIACFRWALDAPASGLLAEPFRAHPESLVPAFAMAADRLEGRVPRQDVMRWLFAPSPALDGARPSARANDLPAFAAALETEAALRS